jgi:alpha-L-fucosidase
VALPNQTIESVALLGSNSKLQFQQQPDALHIQLPAQAPGKYASAFRITFSGAAKTSGHN